MKKFQFLLASGVLMALLLTGCGTALTDPEYEDEPESDFGSADWNRIATYTDGVDMQTGFAILTFADDGTFVSSTEVCTATGDYVVNATEEGEAETMTMSYVQSDCPGFTVSGMTYDYEMSANDEGQEVLTLNAEYMGHIVTEVYTR